MTTLLPVIHVKNEEQALLNAKLCSDVGCEGALIISHGNVNYRRLNKIGSLILDELPEFQIGFNYLDLTTLEAIKFVPDFASYLWCDDGLLDDENEAVQFQQIHESKKSFLKTFGGLAFKYQPTTINLTTDTLTACEIWDVPTTSGTGTGKAPDVSKLKQIRDIMSTMWEPPHVSYLAVASGVSIDNIESFKPYIDYAIVATSISKITDKNEIDFYNLDPDKLKALFHACKK